MAQVPYFVKRSFVNGAESRKGRGAVLRRAQGRRLDAARQHGRGHVRQQLHRLRLRVQLERLRAHPAVRHGQARAPTSSTCIRCSTRSSPRIPTRSSEWCRCSASPPTLRGSRPGTTSRPSGWRSRSSSRQRPHLRSERRAPPRPFSAFQRRGGDCSTRRATRLRGSHQLYAAEHRHQRREQHEHGRRSRRGARPASSPTPSCWSPATSPGGEARERADHDRRRGRDDAARSAARPWATARALSRHLVPRFPHARDEKDLVIHGEAEERQRRGRWEPSPRSLVCGLETEQLGTEVPLEERRRGARRPRPPRAD